MELKDRINELVKYSNKTIPQFAKIIGVKTPQAIRELLSGRTKTLSDSMQYKILEAFPEISKVWLLAGEGEMIVNPEEGQDDDTDVRIYHKRTGSNLIPFYDAETTGGYDGRVSSSDLPVSLKGYVDPGGWFNGSATAAIRHVGDSMTEYPDGCILLVKEVTNSRLLVPGKNYVVETSEYRITKKVQFASDGASLRLHSTNREKYEDGSLVHQPFNVDFDDIRHIYSVLGYLVSQAGDTHFVKV